ncbi:MAG: S53 family peptidase, partial [Actinobacteria bacterium]|nr:S53 family peptidase [Actinomycetota bacterium]
MSFNGFSLAHFSSIRSIGSIVSSFVPRAVEHGLTAVMLLALLFSALVYADGYVLTYSNSSTVPVSYVVQSSQMRLVKIAAPYLLPHGAIKLSGIAPNTKINITLVFNPSHANKLAAFDKAVSTPGSPLYRHYLRRGQFGSLFGADSQTIYLVHKWLGASSLPLGHLSSNQLSISLSTTAARAEHAFSTTLNTIRLPSGRLGYANVTPLMVPAYLLPSLQTVIGMNTTIRPHPFLRLKRSIAYPNFGFNPEALSGKAVTNRSTVSNISFSGPQACSTASQVAASNSSYTADQIATAYNISSFWTRSLFGQGETIALYELEPYLSSDIQAFQSCYGTSTVIQNVSVDGGPGTGAGSGEAVLDIENIIGVAPEAKILVYQAPGSGNGPYDNYSAIINQDLAQVVSTSWGECEQSLPTSYIDAEATLFQQAVSQGQTILAASGDSGSEDCYSSSTPNSPTYLAVDDPGSQPDVTSAGGSSLQALGPPPTQTVWNDSSGASGGGISTIWAMPAWQQSSAVAGVINSYSSNTPCSAPSGSYCREVPDVSASADAAHGYVIYYNSSWDIAGGTSAVAPLWAGVTALINTTCSSPLGFLNPALYKVASAPNSPFGQITQGNNDFTGTNGGKYPAGSGYNMATGLGTPIANLLAADLCGSAPTLTSISPTSGPKAGGTTVTLTGTGFSTTTGSTTVDFGPGNAATSVTCPSATSCSAVSPSGTGTVSVTVTTLGGTSAGVNYTYTTTSSNAPTLTGISPISGPASGATTVTLTGTNFSTTTSGTTVSFGSNAATSVTCSSTTSCSATSPSGTGTVSVTVTTSGGTSNALSYTYTTYSGYNSLVPYRICDTRSLSVKGTFQNQCTGKTILPGGYLTIQVVGYQGNA